MSNRPVIYISSTFFDLQEHRAELILALQSTNVFEVRGMENYGTIDKPPLEQCLEDVDGAEFYVLLLGSRYGFIPENQKLSITNLEYKKAIGDDDIKTPAGKRTNKARCVLPFIADDNYIIKPGVTEMLEKERKTDGEALTQTKQANLEALKAEIRNNYTINKNFTTSADLVAKVMGALLPELVRRKYGALMSDIKLHEQLVYRCNRVRPREEFLFKNSRLFRMYVIHGEGREMPGIFSNNISRYDLNIAKQIEINNLDEYSSSDADRFLTKLAIAFHFRIYGSFPGEDEYSFEKLADQLLNDPQFTNMIIRIELGYQSWMTHYAVIEKLFEYMEKLKPMFSGDKNLYLLFIVKYKTPDNNLEKAPKTAAVLDKLGSVHLYDIEDWVGTYFYSNSDITLQNRKELLTREIIQYYFKDYYEEDKSFPMEEAVKRLTNIVYDFNNNANLFENYQNLYGN